MGKLFNNLVYNVLSILNDVLPYANNEFSLQIFKKGFGVLTSCPF
jgi:hypothetical protein